MQWLGIYAILVLNKNICIKLGNHLKGLKNKNVKFDTTINYKINYVLLHTNLSKGTEKIRIVAKQKVQHTFRVENPFWHGKHLEPESVAEG